MESLMKDTLLFAAAAIAVFGVRSIWEALRYAPPEQGLSICQPSKPSENCWSVLGIEPTTDLQKIKQAYRRLVKQYHPDIAGHAYNLKCARITEAYREALRSI